MEITFATSDGHETMLDRMYNAFHEDKNEMQRREGGTEDSGDHDCEGTSTEKEASKETNYTVKIRSRPWTPHGSIAYDNPGPSPIPMEYFLSLIRRFPTLTSPLPRDIAAISLWNTAGKLEQWKCIDRIEF